MMPSPNPKISVIVPVYNTEKYLRRCIDSILAQTFTDFELLLIDDGSKDSSGAICDEYAAKESRVRVFHKDNGGVSSARNMGLDNAKGEWISFVDSDDWVDYTFLELVILEATKYKADVVFCDSIFEFSNKQKRYQHYSWEKPIKAGLAEYITTTWTCLWGCIINRSIISNNHIECPVNITYCEDFHFMVRVCFYAKAIKKIPKALYHYNQRETSAVHSLSLSTQEDEIWVYSDIIEFLKVMGQYNNNYKKVMAWRLLKASQELAIHVKDFKRFKLLYPEKKDFIFGCPFVSRIGKLNMWFLTHRLTFLSFLYVSLRKYVR